MISTNALFKQTSFSVPVTKTMIENVLGGFCFGQFNDDFSQPCDHLEQNVFWTIQPDGKGKYFFYNEGSKNYLSFSMNGSWRRVSLGGNKFAFNIENKRDPKSFRISLKEGANTYCLDSAYGGYFEQCDQDDDDKISFYYLFNQEPYTPLVEPDVLYAFGFRAGEDHIYGWTPALNDINKRQDVTTLEISNWFVGSLFRFHPHPTEQGVYQIINSEGFSFFVESPYPWTGTSYFTKTNEKDLFQWFRLIRSPFSPDRMYIKLHSKPNFLIQHFAFTPGRNPRNDNLDYQQTVQKTCLDIPQVRENVWYQIRDNDNFCLTNVEGTLQLKFMECSVKPEFFWKFNWDEKHKGFIITQKKTGKVINYQIGRAGITDLADLRDDIAQRWAFLDRSHTHHTMIALVNRYQAFCFRGNNSGGCNWNSYYRPVQPIFKLAREAQMPMGYVGTCGKESGIAPNPPQPPVNVPQTPVNVPQTPVNVPQTPVNVPQIPVNPPRPILGCRRRRI